jgi:hypothetical protein
MEFMGGFLDGEGKLEGICGGDLGWLEAWHLKAWAGGREVAGSGPRFYWVGIYSCAIGRGA